MPSRVDPIGDGALSPIALRLIALQPDMGYQRIRLALHRIATVCTEGR